MGGALSNRLRVRFLSLDKSAGGASRALAAIFKPPRDCLIHGCDPERRILSEFARLVRNGYLLRADFKTAFSRETTFTERCLTLKNATGAVSFSNSCRCRFSPFLFPALSTAGFVHSPLFR